MILERTKPEILRSAQDDNPVVPSERSTVSVILRPVFWPIASPKGEDLGFDSGENQPRDPSHSLGMTNRSAQDDKSPEQSMSQEHFANLPQKGYNFRGKHHTLSQVRPFSPAAGGILSEI